MNESDIPTHNNGEDSGTDSRVDQLVARFHGIDSEEARSQIGLLPYYHAIENAITKPNQGTWTTRYFRTKWRPTLGHEAAEIVLTLRFSADKQTGETIASIQTIARIAGLGKRTLERWLSSTTPSGRSDAWLSQWKALHRYFLISKKARYIQKTDQGRSQVRRTTNRLRVAMDDPVHPDDQGKLYAEAAKRMAMEEPKPSIDRVSSYGRPAGGKRDAEIVREDARGAEPVDNSTLNRPSGGYSAPPDGRGISLDNRTNVNNVSANKEKRPGSLFRLDPRVRALSPEEVKRKELLTFTIGRTLNKINGNTEDRDHPYQGFHRKVAYFMPESEVRAALAAAQDKKDDRGIEKNAESYFTGFIKNRANQLGIGLDVKADTKSPV